MTAKYKLWSDGCVSIQLLHLMKIIWGHIYGASSIFKFLLVCISASSFVWLSVFDGWIRMDRNETTLVHSTNNLHCRVTDTPAGLSPDLAHLTATRHCINSLDRHLGVPGVSRSDGGGENNDFISFTLKEKSVNRYHHHHSLKGLPWPWKWKKHPPPQ